MSTMPSPVAEVHEGLIRVVFTAHMRWNLALQLSGRLIGSSCSTAS